MEVRRRRNITEGLMSKLLFIKSSILGANSKSSLIAEEFIETWKQNHPGAEVVARDLGASPVSHLALDHLGAVMTPADKRSSEQAENVAAADVLIGELEEAATIVIASPMYNFSISTNLRAWIDHVVRAGRTFRYTEGPMAAFDFQEPYLRTILGFIGLTNIHFIHVEGLRISADAAAKGIARARARIG